MPLSIINASGVNKTYREGSLIVDAAKEVDLVLPIGALAVIMGPSGGGKSTLLHLLGGLDRPDSGTLEVAGVCLDKASEKELNQFRRQKVGFIFQFYNLLPSFNALDNVCLPLLARGERQKNARNLAKDALEKVGLASRMKHRPGQLSGGEQQRVADEPTGNLDSNAAKEVVDLFVDLNRSMGISFVIATHNSEIQSIASHGFEMRDGYLKQI
jgi:lipoprotein-releasing system ATP-binding protein